MTTKKTPTAIKIDWTDTAQSVQSRVVNAYDMIIAGKREGSPIDWSTTQELAMMSPKSSRVLGITPNIKLQILTAVQLLSECTIADLTFDGVVMDGNTLYKQANAWNNCHVFRSFYTK